jgi:ATP-dependent exoDNAse (exonuclease V) beta subunit
VLALDRELFLDSKTKLSRRAHLKLLLGEPPDANAEQFEALTATPQACALTSAAALELQSETGALPSTPGVVDQKVTQKARRRAADFVHKISPSGYDEEIPRVSMDEISGNPSAISFGRSTADTPATLYGRWWHDFIQRISWHDESSWRQIFEEHQVKSPAATRSANEWELFLQCLKNDLDFSELLTRTKLLTHPEMPFFWRIDDSRCLEGIIDLALFDPSATRWMILDWKTNRITPNKLENLRLQYRPQIAAYWKAVEQMSGMPVEAGIYSTANGQFVVYDERELATEWERLRTLPLNDLAWEIEADGPVSNRARRG